jgi:hypothetical protein
MAHCDAKKVPCPPSPKRPSGSPELAMSPFVLAVYFATTARREMNLARLQLASKGVQYESHDGQAPSH